MDFSLTASKLDSLIKTYAKRRFVPSVAANDLGAAGGPPRLPGGGIHDLEVVGHRGGLRQHRRGGAVLLNRQLDGAPHPGRIDPAPAHHEVHVDAGEDPRLGLGAVGVQLGL